MGPRISGSWQSTEFGKGKQSNLQAQNWPLETIVSKLFFAKKILSMFIDLLKENINQLEAELSE